MAVGKPVPMLDAEARVRGTVPYAVNLRLPGMLVARVLRSPLPHARILRIDTSAAEAIPGVVAVLTAADLDKPGAPKRLFGQMTPDQQVVAGDKVRYVGDPVALVAAETEAAAEAALEAIEVDYEELPAVFDPLEAMQPGAPVIHEGHPDNVLLHAKIRHGDLEAGFAEADEIIEETFTSPVAQQTSLEPHVAAAQWEDGRLTVWSAAQSPYIVRRVLAEMFGLEPEAIRIVVPPLGGGYGGKGHVRIEPMVAALAWKVGGRPVKLTLSRAEEFVTVTKHYAVIRMKTGVKRDGTLAARQVTAYWGAGGYADASPLLVRAAVTRVVGPYRIPAVHVDSYAIYTNLPPAAAYRGAMSSQGTWAYESHMDTIAHRLGMDPLELRLKNLLRDGDIFCTGEEMHDVHFVECLEDVARRLGWGQPFDRGSGTRRRGRGLAVMMKSTVPTSRSECRMEVDAQGTLTLYTSTVEMGQGAHTALAQIAAEAVGAALESIRVVGPDTAVTPFDTMTAASRSTNMMGTAVLRGGERLRQRLLELAAPLLESPPESLAVAEGHIFVRDHPEERVSFAEVLARHGLERLEARGEHETRGGLDPETGQGIGSPHYHQGAGACEVEVDTETGKVRILRYTAASYAGRVVNPALARLQNDGNVVYGLGPTLLEELVFDNGQPINTNLSDYMIPSFLDIPERLESAALEVEGGEFHGIGEMTLPPVAPAVANAIYDAVGVRIRDLPITAERLLRALRDG